MVIAILVTQRRLILLALLAILAPAVALAQGTTAIRGVVVDEQKAALPGAVIVARHAASGLERQATTDTSGAFELPNLPGGVHDLTVSLPGFAPHQQRVEASRGVPLSLDVMLKIAAFTDTVQVMPTQSAIDTTSAGTRHEVSVTRIERMPVAVSSRGIEAVLVAFPGFAQNANGAIHPRGAHNQMTFMIDGLAISDQLTRSAIN
jgi:hypothetical protein